MFAKYNKQSINCKHCHRKDQYQFDFPLEFFIIYIFSHTSD